MENEGFVNGVIVACRDERLKVTWCAQEEQWIHLNIHNADGIDYRLTSVHASPSEQKRKRMWEELRSIANTEMLPWIVVGDFNDIANAKEEKVVLKHQIKDVLYSEIIWKIVSFMTWDPVV